MDLKRGVRGSVLEARDDGVTDYVADDGSLYREQVVDDVLAECAHERSEDRFRGFRIAPDMRRVASIPVAVIDLYAARGVDLLRDPEAMRRFLIDPDNAAFRCTNERL